MWTIILSVFLILSVILNGVFVYCSWNSIKKMEQLEEWVTTFRTQIDNVYKRLKFVDEKNLFEKDDDVGFVFSELVRIMKEFDDTIQ